MAKSSKSKNSGIGIPHIVGVFILAVLFAVGQDIAKSETESILKRNGYWPRA